MSVEAGAGSWHTFTLSFGAPVDLFRVEQPDSSQLVLHLRSSEDVLAACEYRLTRLLPSCHIPAADACPTSGTSLVMPFTGCYGPEAVAGLCRDLGIVVDTVTHGEDEGDVEDQVVMEDGDETVGNCADHHHTRHTPDQVINLPSTEDMQLVSPQLKMELDKLRLVTLTSNDVGTGGVGGLVSTNLDQLGLDFGGRQVTAVTSSGNEVRGIVIATSNAQAGDCLTVVHPLNSNNYKDLMTQIGGEEVRLENMVNQHHQHNQVSLQSPASGSRPTVPQGKKFICPQCGAEFKRNWNLYRHQSSIHQNNQQDGSNPDGSARRKRARPHTQQSVVSVLQQPQQIQTNALQQLGRSTTCMLPVFPLTSLCGTDGSGQTGLVVTTADPSGGTAQAFETFPIQNALTGSGVVCSLPSLVVAAAGQAGLVQTQPHTVTVSIATSGVGLSSSSNIATGSIITLSGTPLLPAPPDPSKEEAIEPDGGDPTSGVPTTPEHVCEKCGLQFNRVWNLQRHRALVHGRPRAQPGRLIASKVCPLCRAMRCRQYKQLIDHVRREHRIPALIEQAEFPGEVAFLDWKHDVEARSGATFAQKCGSNEVKDSVNTYFACNRTGVYQSKSAARQAAGSKEANENGEVAAVWGWSVRMGATCTAFIRTAQNKATGRIRATFCLTHLGH